MKLTALIARTLRTASRVGHSVASLEDASEHRFERVTYDLIGFAALVKRPD
jgi:hypothetical protein